MRYLDFFYLLHPQVINNLFPKRLRVIHLKPGFHIIVSDVGIVSVAKCLVRRLGRSYRNTLAIVSNDLYIRSDLILPIEHVLSLRPDCVTKNSATETIPTSETIIWKPGSSCSKPD